MKLYVKYMVSLRCKLVVKYELEKLGLQFTSIELGMVEVKEIVSNKLLLKLKSNLALSGLELLKDKKSILVDKIKNVIIEMIHYSNEMPKSNNSDYIARKLNYNYTYLSNLFFEVKGVTIQHFIIKNKIEKAKELILYDELNLTQIAYKLNYSSVAHLSNQFKKITGYTPTYYKKTDKKRKRNLENL